MSIPWVVAIVFIVLFGGGFWWGWFVRGWEVKKLKKKCDQLCALLGLVESATDVYACSAPEYIGSIPPRVELPCLPKKEGGTL